MNDMPGWGGDAEPGQPPVPPPPAAPTAPHAPPPGAPASGVPAPGYGAPPPVPAPGYGAPPPVPGYGAAPGYAGQVAGPYGAPAYPGMVTTAPPGRGLQIAGLVLGICSLFVIFSWVTATCGIIGVILGAVGMSKAKKAGAPTGMGLAGVICGAIGTIGSIALLIFVIASISSSGYYF